MKWSWYRNGTEFLSVSWWRTGFHCVEWFNNLGTFYQASSLQIAQTGDSQLKPRAKQKLRLAVADPSWRDTENKVRKEDYWFEPILIPIFIKKSQNYTCQPLDPRWTLTIVLDPGLQSPNEYALLLKSTGSQDSCIDIRPIKGQFTVRELMEESLNILNQ